MDPRHLYRLRLETARQAAKERIAKERGEPATPEEQKQFDEEVDRLVTAWTKGWEGSGLPGGVAPRTAWFRRRARRPKN